MVISCRCSVKSEQVDDDNNIDNMPLEVLFDCILISQPSDYVDNIIAKLKKEGITNGRMLYNLHHVDIQTKLMSLSQFSLGETCDIVEVCHRLMKRSSREPRDKNRIPRDRSRSRGGIGRHRKTSFRGDCNRGFGDKGKSSRPGLGESKPLVVLEPPPVLWKAVEEGDFDEVQRIMHVNDCDPDETHKR